jgi:hypothetical protein
MFLTPEGEIETMLLLMSDWTGSIFLSLMLIVFIILIIGLAFPLPLEWTAIFILPLLLTLMAFDASFYPAGAALLVYVSFIIATNLLKR